MKLFGLKFLQFSFQVANPDWGGRDKDSQKTHRLVGKLIKMVITTKLQCILKLGENRLLVSG